MTDKTYKYEDKPQGISWARIGGNAFAIGLHAVAFMLMMAPVNPPDLDKADEEVTQVSFIEPPPPPPPPPPPEPPKVVQRIIEQPRPTPVPPPPEEPPVVFDDPSPIDIEAPPPAPPAPPDVPAPGRRRREDQPQPQPRPIRDGSGAQVEVQRRSAQWPAGRWRGAGTGQVQPPVTPGFFP
jgi:periplasmic protein TonB